LQVNYLANKRAILANNLNTDLNNQNQVNKNLALSNTSLVNKGLFIPEDLDHNYLTSDFGNFNYDREKINKLNLDKKSKRILDNNHLILKLTEGYLDNSINSDVSSSNNNKSILNSSNYMSISTFNNEENNLVDKNFNDDDVSDEYLTIKSNIINACNVSRLSIKSEDDLNTKNANNDRCDELLFGLHKKDFESIVILFEIFFIMLWYKEFCIQNNLLEECLVLIIEINDDNTNKEKIFFRLSEEENNKFIPFNKKNNANDVN